MEWRALTSRSGRLNSIFLSSLPGLISAGSRVSGLFVAISTLMLPRGSKPSSWLMSSSIVRCTSLSPPAPSSKRAPAEETHEVHRGRGTSRPWTQRCHSGCNTGHLGKWLRSAHKYLWWVKKVWGGYWEDTFQTRSLKWIWIFILSMKGSLSPCLTGQAAGIYPGSLFCPSLNQNLSPLST